jgi:hypothetical protein
LTILDSIVADIEQENIDDVAAYFAALWYTHWCAPSWHWGRFMLYYEYHLAVMREWHRLTVFGGWGVVRRGGVAVIKKANYPNLQTFERASKLSISIKNSRTYDQSSKPST